MNFDKDPLGKAIDDFHNNSNLENIVVQSDLCEDDIIAIDYLFRNYNDMPPIEKKALSLCEGEILDVGAGAGCHTKWLLENKKKVFAIDNSKGSIDYLKSQNFPCEHIDFLHVKNKKYDTILLLMNGLGIAQKMSLLKPFLLHAKSILNTNGQIICDSTDIRYLYEDEEGGTWFDLNSEYYGEMQFKMTYRSTESDWFSWLYIDFNSLDKICQEIGLKAEKIIDSENDHYLAKITIL